jgi:hypothetical protein
MNPTVRTQNSNTPEILSVATALAANPARVGFLIQNLGTNPLFVRYGAAASSTVFHVVLKGSTVQDDGTGGVATMAEGAVYTGIVTIAGTSPRYTVLEMAP